LPSSFSCCSLFARQRFLLGSRGSRRSGRGLTGPSAALGGVRFWAGRSWGARQRFFLGFASFASRAVGVFARRQWSRCPALGVCRFAGSWVRVSASSWARSLGAAGWSPRRPERVRGVSALLGLGGSL